MQAVMNDNLLYRKLKKTLTESFITDRIEAQGVYEYPRLPRSPFTKDWEKITLDQLRSIVSEMIRCCGKNREKGNDGKRIRLSVGDPPEGWPNEQIPWNKYKGATRCTTSDDKNLGKSDFTDIIVGMLRAGGFDPNKHIVRQEDEEEGPEEIEDEVVEEA